VTEQSFAAPPQLALTGQSAILIDAASGKVLYEKNSHAKRFPASTTKVLTAILALENLDLDQTGIVDNETPYTEGSRIYLVEGEEVTNRDVLYGLLLESANDAAVHLAKQVSGNLSDFIKLMNRKAKKLGATDSQFINPNGLHEDDHLSTAYDQAMIARYAMRNPLFRDYVSTYKYDMAATNKQDERHFYNTNRMLYDEVHKVTVGGLQRACKYDGVTGIKTGYTSKAGGCLVASAKRGDTELIAVTLASTDMGRFADCITLLDYGFSQYRTVNLMKAGESVGQVSVKRGEKRRVDVQMASDVCAVLPLEASDEMIRTELVLEKALQAPFKKGTSAGVLQVYAGDELCGEYKAVTAVAVDRGGLLSVIGIPDDIVRLIRNIVLAVLGSVLLLLLVYIMIKRRQIRRKKERRRRQKLRSGRYYD
jgi:D-alanyl-D-alanine carboxypeptidase (penicillin-binding protein 5/6)